MRIPYINSHYSSYGQYLISEGLEKMYQASRGSSYKEWHALLSKGEDRWEEPLFCDTFLLNGLERGANVFPLYLEALADLDEEDKHEVVGSPFYEEPDRGPASMWEWVHKDRLPGALVGEPRVRQHRQWAYTFWDGSRLERAGLLTDPSISGLGPLTELGLEKYDLPGRQANLAISQAARARIWASGGTGWWSATDQTKVVWPKPNRTSTRIIQPRSLADAKRFLLRFKNEKC
ncbi:uncharacterized protein PG986_003882 [Apiospora aurea]|uniref:Uncharacterized protein n=1 Tax=Apiospora aurea TaxID=335848 RepID=A0ABR1QL07_9PEZI